MKTNAVLGQPYLRGVGSDIISAGTETTVATFVDGYYLPALRSRSRIFTTSSVSRC
ncbi:MAG: hypothetical protein KDI88_17490 [Gammaproteobacteria bacterium]|nr:hypothetical protein [Gammaproteobacteria bacterium]